MERPTSSKRSLNFQWRPIKASSPPTSRHPTVVLKFLGARQQVHPQAFRDRSKVLGVVAAGMGDFMKACAHPFPLAARPRKVAQIAPPLLQSIRSKRDEQVARWIGLTESRQVVSGNLPETREGRPGIPKSVKRELGIEDTDAKRAVKVAGIAPEAKQAARAAGLDDNRSALLAASKEIGSAAQVAKISELAQAKINKPPAPDLLLPVGARGELSCTLYKVPSLTLHSRAFRPESKVGLSLVTAAGDLQFSQ